MLQQENRKRTIWLNEDKLIASFHFVDGWQQKELVCSNGVFMQFLQNLQSQGYRFQ